MMWTVFYSELVILALTTHSHTSTAELSSTQCTNTYTVTHDRESPKDNYFIGLISSKTLTVQECKDFCTEDDKCKSVLYVINIADMNPFPPISCQKYNISVQALKDTHSDKIVKAFYSADYPTYVTYDRDCGNPFEGPCTNRYTDYVFRGWKPDVKYKLSTNNTNDARTCQDICNEKLECRSVWYYTKNDSLYVNGFCDIFNISVQDLIDTGGYSEIVSRSDKYWEDYPTYETYDRVCDCPIGQEPSRYPGNVCCKHCPRGFFKASMGSDHCTECVDGEVFSKQTSCAVSLCSSGTYLVFHNRTGPALKYSIRTITLDANATATTCKHHCDEDEACRSVTYNTSNFNLPPTCITFTTSVQELPHIGQSLEIVENHFYDENPTYITYDKQCAELSGMKCTNTYPVAHNRMRPNNDYFIDFMINETLTEQGCKDWCTEDDKCKSVFFKLKKLYHQHTTTITGHCHKHGISIQELKDTGKLVITNGNTVDFPTFVTYDKECECPPGLEPLSNRAGFCKPCSSGFFKASEGSEKCTKCVNAKASEDKTSCAVSLCTSGTYAVFHNRTAPAPKYIIRAITVNATATATDCHHYCNKEEACRSVTYIKNKFKPAPTCITYNTSVQELPQTMPSLEIVENTYVAIYPTYITYDKQCDCSNLPTLDVSNCDIDPVDNATCQAVGCCFKEPTGLVTYPRCIKPN